MDTEVTNTERVNHRDGESFSALTRLEIHCAWVSFDALGYSRNN